MFGEGSVVRRKCWKREEFVRFVIVSDCMFGWIRRMNNRKRKGCEAVRGGRGPQHGLAEQM